MRYEKLDGYKAIVKVYIKDEGRPSQYFALYEEAEVGATVVCTSIHGQKVGTIEAIIKPDMEQPNEVYREVICVCDVSGYCDRLTRREKILVLKEKMNRRLQEIKELKEDRVYELLAQEDNELSALLMEYTLVKDN